MACFAESSIAGASSMGSASKDLMRPSDTRPAWSWAIMEVSSLTG